MGLVTRLGALRAEQAKGRRPAVAPVEQPFREIEVALRAEHVLCDLGRVLLVDIGLKNRWKSEMMRRRERIYLHRTP